MDLSHYDRVICSKRRTQLANRLGNQPALIPAGAPRNRATFRSQYIFRATSHFLYLFGLHLPRAMGLWTGETWKMFLPEPAPDAHLWTGPEPDFSKWSEILGIPVSSSATLSGHIEKTTTRTLPSPDLETCLEQGKLLGRELRPGQLAPIDEPLADALIALRLVHDEAAVAGLREACLITTAAHKAGLRATRPGILESVVHAAIEAQFIAHNTTNSYNSIVSVHGEVLHNEAHHYVLDAGDLLLVDAGAETPGGWAGDVTRTWPVSGAYSATQRELYQLVLTAEKAAVAAIRPGVRYLDLHGIAAKTMAEGLVALGILSGDPSELVSDGVVALFFPHGVGHLIGLDVHDLEDLGDRATYAQGRVRSTNPGLKALRLDRDLVPNMAVTIEPGFYQVDAILKNPERTKIARDRLHFDQLAKFSDVRGIRIEDTILVTQSGYENLTIEIPKEIEAIETAMVENRTVG